MIVKFFRRSKESGSAPFNYFLGTNRDRKYARVISGDPIITEHLINATKYEHKYKSGVLSFAERANELTEQQKIDIMDGFEQTLFAGLERDQYDITWIEHSDKDIDDNNPIGRLELNFVIPCQELRSGERLQPFYKGTDLKRVNAWKNIINYKVKTIEGMALADPTDPSRKRLLNPYLGTAPRPTPYDRKPKKMRKNDLDMSSRDALRESVEQHLLAEFNEGWLTDRDSVIDELDNLGLIIERTVKSSITVSHPKLMDKNGVPLRVRLTGGLYTDTFNANDYQPAAQTEHESDAYRRNLRTEIIYGDAMAYKTAQNRELYKDAMAQSPLMLDIKPIFIEPEPEVTQTVSTTAQPSLRRPRI